MGGQKWPKIRQKTLNNVKMWKIFCTKVVVVAVVVGIVIGFVVVVVVVVVFAAAVAAAAGPFNSDATH